MILVDSSVWIDFFDYNKSPQVDWLASHIRSNELAVGDLVLCEVLRGFQDQNAFEEARLSLSDFPLLDISGQTIAIKAAKNYIALRRRGITIRKTIDTLLATFCIENGHLLLHNDCDFDPFEKHLGLQVIHP